MIEPKKAKKASIFFTLGIIFNLFMSILLFAGANFVSGDATEKGKDVVGLAKKEGTYIAYKLLGGFQKLLSGADEKELRDEDPGILASQNSYDVNKYDLELSFDIQEKSINGTFYMHVSVLDDTLSKFYINLYDNLKVNSVSYTAPGSHVTENEDIRIIGEFTPVNFTQNKNYVVISPENKFKKDSEVIIKINYSGVPKKLGFDSFSFKKIHNNMCIYNLSEPNYGPTWWPSKDLPDDKAIMQMRLHVPTGYKGVSNGMFIDSVQNNNGTTTFTWKTNYPIATYLVSIVVSEFSYWEQTYTSIDGNKQMPVAYYVFPKDSAKSVADWSITPEMIKFLAETFGEYPFIDEKYGMAQFGWTSGAMEHQTITSMGYLLVTGDRRYDNVVIHELAHQWFGDALTLKNWKNIWLNEGFASYCEALWEEHKSGKQAYFDHMKSIAYETFTGTVYAPEEFIDNFFIYATIYNKGSWVLHMMRGVMGDEQFFKACRQYYEKYKFSNAETSQLVEVFEEVYGQKLDWFFDQWVYKGTGRPSYEYSWRFEDFQGQSGTGVYTVRLQLIQVQKNDIQIYKMPVKVTVKTNAGEKEFTVFNDSREQSFQFTVDSEPKEVIVDKDGWILKKIAKGKYDK